MTSVEPARKMSLAEEAGLLGNVSASDLAESIARRAYSVDSIDALASLEESIEEGLPSLEDLLYMPLIFLGAEYLPSTYEGNDVFGVFQVAHATPVKGQKAPACDWAQVGDPFLVSCGARNVVFGIAGCMKRGELPAAFVIVTKRTGAGFDAFWPRPISKKHPLPDKPKTLAQKVRERQEDTADEKPF